MAKSRCTDLDSRFSFIRTTLQSICPNTWICDFDTDRYNRYIDDKDDYWLLICQHKFSVSLYTLWDGTAITNFNLVNTNHNLFIEIKQNESILGKI